MLSPRLSSYSLLTAVILQLFILVLCPRPRYHAGVSSSRLSSDLSTFAFVRSTYGHLILRLLKYTHYFLRRAIILHIPQEFSTIDDGYSLTPRCDVGGLLRIIFHLYLYINIIHYFLHYVKRFVLYFCKSFRRYRTSVGVRMPEQFLSLSNPVHGSCSGRYGLLGCIAPLDVN